MSVIGSNILAGSSGQGGAGGYAIERSLRFNSGDSSYLNRTPSSAGNRKTWTWSGWVKRSKIDGTRRTLFRTDSSQTHISFSESALGNPESILVYWGSGGGYFLTDAVFRDPSAWYHIVLAFDTTQATANDRVKLYVNGERLEDFSSTNRPSQNYETGINATNAHGLGANSAGGELHDGYLADIHFIDGQALAPSDFGETDSNGVWQPKLFAGTYGTNGFHLDFSDGTDLGNDSSGANNDWTPNNLVGQLGTGDLGMDVATYTGNGGTQSISSLKFSPGLVWIKARGHQDPHALFDTVRGVQKRLSSNLTNAEVTSSDGITSFNSNGFTMGANGSNNANNLPYVAWAWKAGGAAVSNTDGTITSQVSANQTHGFSIVSYTGSGNNSNTATSPAVSIGHGLGAAPSMIIVKDRTSARNWPVYHVGIGTSSMCELDTTGAAQATYSWNQTAPSSSVFYVGNNGQTNNNGNNYIAYCWSEVAGYSKFGSVSAGSDPIITTGFKPRFVMVKPISGGNWNIFDTARGGGTTQIWLEWNSSGAENNHVNGQFKFLDNGFQLIGPDIDVGTVIYMAFAAGGDGADLDLLLDTPEQRSDQTDSGSGGDVVGNYATLNPSRYHGQT